MITINKNIDTVEMGDGEVRLTGNGIEVYVNQDIPKHIIEELERSQGKDYVVVKLYLHDKTTISKLKE